MLLFLYFSCVFFYCIYLFLESGREREREGEKHQCVFASHVPHTGDLAHNPGTCPGLGIEPATLWFADLCSIHWTTPARAPLFFINKPLSLCWPQPSHAQPAQGTKQHPCPQASCTLRLTQETARGSATNTPPGATVIFLNFHFPAFNSLKHRSASFFFYKGPYSKYVWFCRSYVLCLNHSTLP